MVRKIGCAVCMSFEVYYVIKHIDKTYLPLGNSLYYLGINSTSVMYYSTYITVAETLEEKLVLGNYYYR